MRWICSECGEQREFPWMDFEAVAEWLSGHTHEEDE